MALLNLNSLHVTTKLVFTRWHQRFFFFVSRTERLRIIMKQKEYKTNQSGQSLSRVQLFGTPWTTTRQASLSITNYWSLPKLMSIETVMPSNYLILCRPLLLPSTFPSIRVFSNESALCIRWPKYWSYSFNIRPPVNTQDWSPLGWTGWISLQSTGLSREFSNTTVQKHQFFCAQLSL